MIEQLIAIGVQPTQAKAFAEPLKAAAALYDISTPQRISAFVAHCAVESAHFTRLEENLFYTTPERAARVFLTAFDLNRDRKLTPNEIDFAAGYVRNPKALANIAYARRNGNGDEASGDGWRYRGRGLFQLTGRRNYQKASQALARDYLGQPELVALPTDACLTAAWYWNSTGCNQLVDAGRFDATTVAINGPAALHAKERLALFNEALEEFA